MSHWSFLAQVLQGLDYISTERDQQHRYLKKTILDHFRAYEEALLVIEEYDKLDCPTRAVLRQFITAPATTNVTLTKWVSPLLICTSFLVQSLHDVMQHHVSNIHSPASSCVYDTPQAALETPTRCSVCRIYPLVQVVCL